MAMLVTRLYIFEDDTIVQQIVVLNVGREQQQPSLHNALNFKITTVLQEFYFCNIRENSEIQLWLSRTLAQTHLMASM